MDQPSLIDEVSEDQINPTFPNMSDDDFCYEEVESRLEVFLEKELVQFTPLDIEPITENDVNCKYRYSSAMQKSIRRGYVEDSIRYAMTYHSVDPAGFWTRLVVIAFEDVGIAGSLEVACTLIAAKSKVWRKKAGEEKVLQYIVQMLASATKSRSACDYMIFHWNNPRKFREANALRTATLQELCDFALSERLSTAFRSSSAWVLAGTDRYENKNLPLRSGSRNTFSAMVTQMKIPTLVKYITLRGMTACRYPMPIVYPFLWQMKQKSLYINVEKIRFPVERFYIGGLPEETYDQYVRTGKQSLAYFAKSCPQVNQFLTNKGIVGTDARIAAIAAAVFITSSAKLDRELQFEGACEIYEAAELADYAKAGLSLDDGRALAKMIEDNRETLRQSRIRVVEG